MNYVIYPGGAGGSYISYKINEWSGLIDINHHRLQHRGLNEYRSHRNNVVFKFHPSVEKDSVYYSQNVLDSDTTFIIEVDDQQKVFVDLIRFFKWFFQKNYYGMAIDLIEKFMENY